MLRTNVATVVDVDNILRLSKTPASHLPIEQCEFKWEKSALSMHARDKHQNDFSLDNFSVAVVKKVSPQQLRREEFRFVDKYKTIPQGLNRYKV